MTLTASIGLAAYPEHGQYLTELLEAADGALYAAKRAGRDRVGLPPGRHRSSCHRLTGRAAGRLTARRSIPHACNRLTATAQGCDSECST